MRENGQDLNLQHQKSKKSTQIQNLYKCSLCRDTGIILKNDDGLQDVYIPCKCKEIDKIKEKWKASGINVEQSRQSFGNYKCYNDITKLCKNTAIQYYKNFDSIKDKRENSIAFLGQVGSGKTHLSIAIAVNLLENKKIPVLYMPYRDVITSIKQNMLDREYYVKQLGRYQKAKVLIIDDLFKGKVTESDVNILFELINYRYLNCLPSIISSEFTAEEILNFDEGVGSRILEMCEDYTVEIHGKENNYRITN
ncbi:ATP-binding protein [Clostridium tetani]|uniref:ATP-binding protein n=1 Tax=Clostridium tetani TaxID=1513 RepID=UPI002954036E|nr:ATP-binding protein [Clostridium tetani]